MSKRAEGLKYVPEEHVISEPPKMVEADNFEKELEKVHGAHLERIRKRKEATTSELERQDKVIEEADKSRKSRKDPTKPMFSEPQVELSTAEKLAKVKKGGPLIQAERVKRKVKEIKEKALKEAIKESQDPTKPMFSEPQVELSTAEKLAKVKKGGHLAQADKERLDIKQKEKAEAKRVAKRIKEITDEVIYPNKSKKSKEKEVKKAGEDIAEVSDVSSVEKVSNQPEEEIELTDKDIEIVEDEKPEEEIELTEKDIEIIEEEKPIELKDLSVKFKAKLDRILEAYEEAQNAQKFMDFMLKVSPMLLTKEEIENNSTINQYLKSNFKEEELGLRYDDFLVALPTKEDYVDHARGGKIEEAVKHAPDTNQIPELHPQSGEISAKERKNRNSDNSNSPKVEIEQRYAKESRLYTEAKIAYVRAYREYDPSFTTNKPDDLVAEAKPPFFAFGFAAKELKRLYGVMVQAGENKGPVSLSEKLKSSPKVDTFLDDITMQRGRGFEKRLLEIKNFFIKKYKMSDVEADKFLLGEEIKGLFKGGQKQMQKEYRSLIDNPAYEKFIKIKPKN